MNPIVWALGALLSVMASSAFADTDLSTYSATFQFSGSAYTYADHTASYNLAASASIDTKPKLTVPGGTLAGVWGFTGSATADIFADTNGSPYNWTHVYAKSNASHPDYPVEQQWQYSTSIADGGGLLQYYVEIVGPAGLVPLNVQGLLWTAADNAGANGYANANARISLHQAHGGAIGWFASYTSKAAAGYAGNPGYIGVQNTDIVHIDTTLQVDANEPIIVSMYSDAFAYAFCDQQVFGEDSRRFCPGAVVADAHADPYFSIPSTFTDAGQYHLEFSPGVGNVPGAPEPSTWAMMLLGFGGLAFARHRRLSKNAPALAEA